MEPAERLRERCERLDAGSAEAVAVALRRAQLLLGALRLPTQAADAFRSVLVDAPDSPEAKVGLEQALRSSIDAGGLTSE